MKKIITTIIAVHCSLLTVHLLAQPCLPEGITFFTQEEVDSFQINYPGCTEIEGDVYIEGSEISNLNGLNVLSAIGGSLGISWNESLQNLTGLEGLTHIGGNFVLNAIGNLQDLTGLENLTSIGGHLQFGSIGTGSSGGTSLVSLAGLEGLDSIGGGVVMVANGQLTDISALDGLTYLGGYLSIFLNQSLAVCQSDWLCDYLLAPNGAVTIMDNAPGCNSVEEVAEECGIVSVEESAALPAGRQVCGQRSAVNVYPNPASNTISLVTEPGTEVTLLEIMDSQGRVLKHQIITNDHLSYDISDLPQGLYFIRLRTRKSIEVRKLVIQ
jgi:hypothetical protein